MKVYLLSRVPFACDEDMMLPHAVYETRYGAQQAKRKLERRDRKGGWAAQPMDIKAMTLRVAVPERVYVQENAPQAPSKE